MNEQPERNRFYVSCTPDTYKLLSKLVQYLGVKPSAAANMVFAVGARTLAEKLLPPPPSDDELEAMAMAGVAPFVPPLELDAEMLPDNHAPDTKQEPAAKKSSKQKRRRKPNT